MKIEVRILNYRYYLYALGLLLTFILGVFLANYIVKTFAHGGNTGLIHACYNARGLVFIVGVSESCGTNETAIDWIKEEKRPFVCTGCFEGAADNLSGLNLSDSYVINSGFDNEDLSNINFTDSVITSSTLTNADLSNSNLTNVDFSESDLTGADFTGTTRTGIEWNNTTCPDGTNSNSHGNTCEGYLTP